jgi:hypothetical protein
VSRPHADGNGLAALEIDRPPLGALGLTWDVRVLALATSRAGGIWIARLH